jgi:hypothetical protein
LSKDKTDKCNLVKDADFLEWFRGFTDAEGKFFINKDFRKSFNLTFMFRLVLHKDDLAVLEYLKYRLKIGEIYPSKITDHNSVTWKIQRKEDVIKIINIFDNYPLNTSKQLNFLDWREAFYLYQSLKGLTGEDKVNTQNI